jgi:hypothetical protein
VVNLCWLDSTEPKQLKIASTATVAGTTETVSLTLQQAPALANTFETQLDTSNFSTATADARAAEIAALPINGGMVSLYDNKTTGTGNAGKNAEDRATLNYYIPNAASTLEARWTNVDIFNTTGGTDQRVLGTQTYPIAGSKNSTVIDTRRFLVPLNGRIMIDPMENSGDSPSTATDNNQNTKISTLAIDDTAGKNVLFRLASGTAALGTGSGTVKNRSASYLNSLLMLNFTDNAGSTETLTYTINTNANKTETITYTWHPNNWESLDLYAQPNSQVTSNIILGPFGHKYNDYLDYWSWANFVDNWNGTKKDEYLTLWPGMGTPRAYGGSALGLTGLGIPIFPVDYGKNASIWILDGSNSRNKWADYTDSYLRIMQGVNIIEGSIYSNRDTIIGGGLVRKDATAKTYQNVNEGTWGYALASGATHSLYTEATTRYSQLIYNTDIILIGPFSNTTPLGTASSFIRRPSTWRDKTVDGTPSNDKTFDPILTIKGGTIYVGDRQHLTIEGTRDKETRAEADPQNMRISPDKIVVAKGGKLTLQKTQTLNVYTDIYVDGGTLIFEATAKVQGNIYVYNGGSVQLPNGGFQLRSSAPTTEKQYDGLFIYGKDVVGTTINGVEITAPGQLKLVSPGTSTKNNGDAGGVHLVGGTWTELVTGTTLAVSDAAVGNFLCPDHDPATGRCLYTHVSGSGSSGTGSSGSGSGGSGSGSGSSGSGSGSGGGSSGSSGSSGSGSGGGWIIGAYGSS